MSVYLRGIELVDGGGCGGQACRSISTSISILRSLYSLQAAYGIIIVNYLYKSLHLHVIIIALFYYSILHLFCLCYPDAVIGEKDSLVGHLIPAAVEIVPASSIPLLPFASAERTVVGHQSQGIEA